MEEALTARLLASASIAAIAATRINWGVRPQGETLAGLTLVRASPGRAPTYKGDAALKGPRVQIDCWAPDFQTAADLARAVIDTLLPPAVQGAISFQAAFLVGERGPTVEDVGGGKQVHRVSLDFFVWFSPAA
jgi:hypothetical protein